MDGSRTAHRVALARAMHQVVDVPRVFEDPLAETVLPDDERAKLADGARTREEEKRRALRAFLVARARRAEDALADAIARGVRQYVVLGAGLDTFGLRNPHGDLTVFELDRPSAQAAKRARLAARGVREPATLRFVPIDLACESIGDALANAGAQATPTFFSWLGVTPYLEVDAVMKQLRAIAAFPAGSGVTFDYLPHEDEMTPRERERLAGLARRVAAAGEPFRSAFRNAELRTALEAMGFSAIEDLDRDALNARYFEGRADGLAVVGSGRIVTARVVTSP